MGEVGGPRAGVESRGDICCSEDDNWGKCFKEVGEGDSGIQCEKCQWWFHGECEGLGERDMNYFAGGDEVGYNPVWICGGCAAKIKGNGDKLEEENRVKIRKCSTTWKAGENS